MSSTADIPAAQWQIDRGPEMVARATPVMVLTTLVVALRLAMTLSRRNAMGYDGWLILFSLVYIPGGGGMGVPVQNGGYS